MDSIGESMYNNVMANLERNYKNNLNKDIHYDGMGTYSILYPKRMIVQLCAYNLSKEYFARILDDSYAPNEIETLAKNFLKDIKMNPETSQLEDLFENFNDNNGFQGKFKDYLEDQISDFGERTKEINKKDLTNEIQSWKKDVEQKIQEFKNANSSAAAKVRESFLCQLKKYLETLLDLHEKKLGVKKNSDGTDLLDRGSVVRTEKFINALHKIFSDAKEKYRKTRNDAESTVASYNSYFETALSDFNEISDGIFSSKKKIHEAGEKILDTCRSLFNAKKRNLIADWCYQLFDGILWNDVPKYDGLLKELENYQRNYQKVIVSFKELDSEISKFLEDNRHFEPGPLFTTIFDYEKDVVQIYKELIAEKSEEFIFGGLSDSVTDKKAFGKDYLGAAKKTSALINIDILTAAEKFFFEPVNKKNIADRILETPEICDRLEDGTYFISAPVYLGVEETVMDREGLNFRNSEFYAISIPDQYDGKPCRDLKGVVRGNGVNAVCPMEADPEKYQQSPCPMFNKCLKQKLLRNAPGNISITPTAEFSEVNIMHSVAGYPLYALSSVMNNCKPEYIKAKENQKKENEENRTEYEEINMFGPLQFDNLDEKTVNPRAKEDEFRKKILAAVIAKRIVYQALSVDFITERDLQLGRIDNPSLHLGDSIDEVMRKFQSSKISDKKIITQFEKETEHYLEKLAENDKLKENFGRKAQKVYAEFNKNLPAGFIDKDLDLMDSLTKEYCGFELINKNPLNDDMFIIGD